MVVMEIFTISICLIIIAIAIIAAYRFKKANDAYEVLDDE